MKRSYLVAVLFAALTLITNLQAQPLITIDTVRVGNPGNAASGTVTASGETFTNWSGGESLTPALQLQYAIGGATSPTATNGVPSVTTVTSNTLSITAVVRTNDPTLTVNGQSLIDLTVGPWTTNNVTMTPEVTAAPEGCQVQTFSNPREAETKKFLRLQTAMPVASGKVPVGIVLPTKDEPRWIQDQTRFTEALKAAGYDVQILFSEGDSAKEKANVEALISQGIEVLIICPHDGTAAAAAAESARDAGVKVISYDRLILDTDAVDYYVTFDSVAVGEAWGQFLAEKTGAAKGNNLYLYTGAASDNNAFLFFEGAWNKLQPKIADGTFVVQNSSEAVALQAKAKLTRDEMAKIIGQVTTNWDSNVAKNLAEANLRTASTDDKGTVFVVAPNDGTARSIADAFAADEDVTAYYITGQDAEKASVQYIIDNRQSMTVLKDVRTLVNDAIAAAVAYLTGDVPDRTTTYYNGEIDIPAKPSSIVTVTKDNVRAAIVDSGYYPASDFPNLE